MSAELKTAVARRFATRLETHAQAVAPAHAGEYGGSLVDYLGADDPGDDEDAWLIPGIVAAGVPQMTAGHPKSCKTFLMEHVALSIAAGIPWLGKLPTRQGNVLVLPREDSVRETRRRIWRLARGLGFDPRALEGRLQIDSVQPFYWQDDDAMRRLFNTIGRLRPSLIVIDSLSRTHLGDENSVKEMAVVTNRWSDLCQQANVAISMIHHFTKSGGTSLLQQLRGSGNIGATLRHLVGVEKPETRGEPFELSFDGNLHPLPAPFRVRMRDDVDALGRKVIKLEHAGTAASAKEQEAIDLMKRVLGVAGASGMTATELARECGVTRGRARIAHNERREALLAGREIEHDGSKYYASIAAMRGVVG